MKSFSQYLDEKNKKRIPYKDWDIDYAGISTYISQVAKAEMQTMGTR